MAASASTVSTSGTSLCLGHSTLGYGRTSFDRNLQGLGLNLSNLRGARRDSLFGGRVEAGYRMPVGKTERTSPPSRPSSRHPMAGFRLRELRELGSGLTYDASTVSALPLYLGLQLDGRWTDGSGAVYMPFLRAAWMHDFSPDGMSPAPSRNCRHWPSRERPSRPCPMRWTCTWGSNPPRWERHPVRQPRCSACERLFHGRRQCNSADTMVTRAMPSSPSSAERFRGAICSRHQARAYDG